MHVTIEGKQGEDKTSFAKQLVGAEKAVFISSNDLFNRDWLLKISEDAPFLSVDEVRDAEKVKAFSNDMVFRYRRKYSTVETTVTMPKITVLIVQK